MACSSCRAVSVQPGATLLTVKPSAATSFERVFAQPVSPARTVFDKSNPSIGCFTEIEVTLTTRPQRRSRIPGTTSRASLTAESAFSSNARRYISRSVSAKVEPGDPPAFVTSTSTWPAASVARLTNASASASFVTSAATPTTSAPVSALIFSAASPMRASSREQMKSRAPSRASSSADANPMPPLAAATRATRPFSPKSILQSPSPLKFKSIP